MWLLILEWKDGERRYFIKNVYVFYYNKSDERERDDKEREVF